MKALVMNAYRSFTYTDVPNPVCSGNHDLLVEIHAAAICGSDVHGFDGSSGRRIPPVIMGHEASGTVVNTGKAVADFTPGDRVTFDSTIYCGRCSYCRSGRVNLCDYRQVLGVSCDDYRRQGTFAQYIVIPERIAYKIPRDLSFEAAALSEPAAVAAHAVRITPRYLNETIAVVGSGLIGLLILQLLRRESSGRIIAFDTEPVRREAALHYGADAAVDPLGDELARYAGTVDRVFEAVGAEQPVQSAVRLAKKGGSVTLVGNISAYISFPLQQVVTREISLYGSCAISGEYPVVLDLMSRGSLDVTSMISAAAPLSQGQHWFERLYSREQGLLKVLLLPKE